MHIKFRLPSPGKPAAIARRYPPFFSFSCVQCLNVSIPPAVRPNLLRQMDLGSLTCAQSWVRAVHTKGGQAQTSLHKSWLGGTEKLSHTLPRQGIEPRVFGLEFGLWPLRHAPCRILDHCTGQALSQAVWFPWFAWTTFVNFYYVVRDVFCCCFFVFSFVYL